MRTTPAFAGAGSDGRRLTASPRADRRGGFQTRPYQRRAEPFAVRCPFCNSEAEIDARQPGEFVCRCGAGTERGKWVEGYL